MPHKRTSSGGTRSGTLALALPVTLALLPSGNAQSRLEYPVSPPHPISPAESTTTPSAQATQQQNPFLGSVPSKNTGTKLQLSLRKAISRRPRYNLCLVESSQASADVRAERLRAPSTLLPQLSANARQAYEDISYKEIGLKVPAIPGLPALSVRPIGRVIIRTLWKKVL